MRCWRSLAVRNAFSSGILLLLAASASHSDVTPERPVVETLGSPTEDWFFNRSGLGAYLFDSSSGDMLGLLSLTEHTPGIAINRNRGEVYAAESYWSRLYRGKREDVLTVYDLETLSPVAEIDIPDKIAEVTGDTNIGLLGNGRYVVVYNLIPAQSVSVIDVESRRFAAEISTPGCAMIMPVEDASFLMVCGDGSVQLSRLSDGGTESKRVRSRKFFSVEDDPVFDRAARTRDGWLLISHSGLVFEVDADGNEISISKPWSIVSDGEREESWRPGGSELLTVHRGRNLAFVLMHRGEVDTHFDSGIELWILDLDQRRQLKRWVLERPWRSILVLQGERPRLIAYGDDRELRIYDALQQRLERTISEPGPGVSLLQGF